MFLFYYQFIVKIRFRYQIFLQLRADLVSGQLVVDQQLFVFLCGLILQCKLRFNHKI